jgi:hypothetical protein
MFMLLKKTTTTATEMVAATVVAMLEVKAEVTMAMVARAKEARRLSDLN